MPRSPLFERLFGCRGSGHVPTAGARDNTAAGAGAGELAHTKPSGPGGGHLAMGFIEEVVALLEEDDRRAAADFVAVEAFGTCIVDDDGFWAVLPVTTMKPSSH